MISVVDLAFVVYKFVQLFLQIVFVYKSIYV
jgi:hypothetical protein